MGSKLKNQILLGKAKLKSINKLKDGTTEKFLVTPNKKFRILVQERDTKTNKRLTMNSIMVFDYTGKATPNSLIKKISSKLSDKQPTILKKRL